MGEQIPDVGVSDGAPSPMGSWVRADLIGRELPTACLPTTASLQHWCSERCFSSVGNLPSNYLSTHSIKVHSCSTSSSGDWPSNVNLKASCGRLGLDLPLKCKGTASTVTRRALVSPQRRSETSAWPASKQRHSTKTPFLQDPCWSPCEHKRKN